MADRNQRTPRPGAKPATPSTRGDEADSSRDDLERNPDPESNRSTASRPRGHTEEPDRTL